MTAGRGRSGLRSTHHVLYSSNCRAGFWRVVTRRRLYTSRELLSAFLGHEPPEAVGPMPRRRCGAPNRSDLVRIRDRCASSASTLRRRLAWRCRPGWRRPAHRREEAHPVVNDDRCSREPSIFVQIDPIGLDVLCVERVGTGEVHRFPSGARSVLPAVAGVEAFLHPLDQVFPSSPVYPSAAGGRIEVARGAEHRNGGRLPATRVSCVGP